MTKLIALYKQPPNPQEFDRQYFGEHLPLAKKIPGLKGICISKVTGSPQGQSEYYMMAELHFDDMESLKTGMSSPESKAAGKNLMGFANGLVTMMFAETENKSTAAGSTTCGAHHA